MKLRSTRRAALDTVSRSPYCSRTRRCTWLAEALLHAHSNDSVALKTLFESTSLFPFHLDPVTADRLAAASGRLDVLRHGLDQELIMLRR